jgi:7-keto-8-aminopelargonate synthetase-like enzyme
LIIIGVGNADFHAMNVLDADGAPLCSHYGIRTERDIVQFVPYSKYSGNKGQALAAEVLAEIPRQVNQFCTMVNFTPQL